MNADDLAESVVELVETCIKDMNVDLVKRDQGKGARLAEMGKEMIEMRKQISVIPKLIKQAKTDGIASMFNGLRVRDTVWFIDDNSTRSPCTKCNATGKVTVLFEDNDMEISCPECRGCKNVTTHKRIAQSSLITSMEYYTNAHSTRNNSFVRVYVKSRDNYFDLDKLYTSNVKCQEAINSTVSE